MALNVKLLERIKSMGHARIQDEAKVSSILQTLLDGGNNQLQLIVDFDYTLSRVHRDGQRLPVSWGVFETSRFVPEEFGVKAAQLKNKYLPIETDAHMSIEEKTPHILQWYKESQQLVTQIPTVNRDTFSKMVKESNVELREGTQTLMKHFSDQKVPVLVLSAGLGDMVVEILVGLEAMQPNMHVVSNFLKYDKEGNILGMKNQLDEIIHVYNKNDKSLNRLGSSGDFVASVASRRNVILVGDSLGDCNMADGVHDPAAILKIGFLNHSVDTDAGKVRLEKYLDAFDIVLVDDQTMNVVNAIAQAIDKQSL